MVGQCFPERQDFAQWRDYAIGLSSAFKWNRGCLLRLANYGKKKKWKIRGVTGPDQSATSFGREWLKGRKESPVCKKEFMIYSTSCLSFLEGRQPTELKVAESANWPRVQAWTTLFANESVPPLDCNALLSMSRTMMLKGNLFLLHKEGVGTCAMGGFGRSTPRSLVINEVFVPKELRGMRYGEDLIAGLVGQAKAREKEPLHFVQRLRRSEKFV